MNWIVSFLVFMFPCLKPFSRRHRERLVLIGPKELQFFGMYQSQLSADRTKLMNNAALIFKAPLGASMLALLFFIFATENFSVPDKRALFQFYEVTDASLLNRELSTGSIANGLATIPMRSYLEGNATVRSHESISYSPKTGDWNPTVFRQEREAINRDARSVAMMFSYDSFLFRTHAAASANQIEQYRWDTDDPEMSNPTMRSYKGKNGDVTYPDWMHTANYMSVSPTQYYEFTKASPPISSHMGAPSVLFSNMPAFFISGNEMELKSIDEGRICAPFASFNIGQLSGRVQSFTPIKYDCKSRQVSMLCKTGRAQYEEVEQRESQALRNYLSANVDVVESMAVNCLFKPIRK